MWSRNVHVHCRCGEPSVHRVACDVPTRQGLSAGGRAMPARCFGALRRRWLPERGRGRADVIGEPLPPGVMAAVEQGYHAARDRMTLMVRDARMALDGLGAEAEAYRDVYRLLRLTEPVLMARLVATAIVGLAKGAATVGQVTNDPRPPDLPGLLRYSVTHVVETARRLCTDLDSDVDMYLVTCGMLAKIGPDRAPLIGAAVIVRVAQLSSRGRDA